MLLFLTTVLPFLAHDHASAAAFLTCRHHNFHGSIIPEFLSDEKRVKSFCEARQQNQLEADKRKQYKNMYALFVQTPLMQFSPSLVLHSGYRGETILIPLLETKYFTRSLQRCSVVSRVTLTTDLLQSLSKVQTLTKMDLAESEVENQHLEIIVNSFPNLKTLTIDYAQYLDPIAAISIAFPRPRATKTLRSLRIDKVDATFAIKVVRHFTNLRKLELWANNTKQSLYLLPLTSALPLLEVMSVVQFNVKNTDSLKNLVHLSLLEFIECRMPDSLSFLTQELNNLPELTTLCIESCDGVLPSSSFASLAHAPNLHVLEVVDSEFDNNCLQYLEDMVHLRTLDLSCSKIAGDSRLLKTLMRNLPQLEQLNLWYCRIGNEGAIAGALYNTHSRLRVLSLGCCSLVDDDLNGIGALKNTLEVVDLSKNYNLSNEGLSYCKDLVKLKELKLHENRNIDDLSPLKDCLNLVELDVYGCEGLADDSFRVFSEEPNSFPNLRVLNLSYCKKLTGKVFEHLSKNTHLVYQLKELSILSISQRLLSSSETAQKNLCRLKGLRKMSFVSYFDSLGTLKKRKLDLGELTNLEGF